MATAAELSNKYGIPLAGSAPTPGVNSFATAPVAKPPVVAPIVPTPITDAMRAKYSSVVPTPAPAAPAVMPLAPIAASLAQKYPPAPVATPITDSFRTKLDAETQARVAALKDHQSPFIRYLANTSTDLVHKAATAADTFVGEQKKNIVDAATGALKVNPLDAWDGFKDTIVGGVKLGGSLAQGLNQGVIRIGKSVASAALPGYKEQIAQPKTPEAAALEKSITGQDDTKTYQQVFSDVHGWAKTNQASNNEANTFAGMTVLGMLFADNPVDAPVGKAGLLLSKDAIDQIAKHTSEDAIAKLVKTENPHLPDKVVQYLAPSLKAAKTPEDVAKVIRVANAAAENAAKKTATQAADETVITPPVNPVSEVTPEINSSGESSIPEHLLPMAEEAKKYNTADEFIASKQPVYHGTDASFSEFDPAKMGTIEKNHAARNAFFFSDSKETAQGYGKNLKEAYVDFNKPVTIDAEGKMFGDMRDVIDNAVLEAKKNGNDGVVIKNISDEKDYSEYNPSTHFAVIDTEAIKTRKQLEELYAQTTKESENTTPPFEPTNTLQKPAAMAEAVKPVSRPQHAYSPNLLKQLGGTKDPYQVLGVLEKEFPHLPDKVLDRVVDRFVKLKRTETIEGLLKSVRELDKKMAGGEIRVAGKDVAENGTKGLEVPASTSEKLKPSEQPLENIPNQIRRVMTQEQKMSYIKTLKDKFEDPGTAVAAEREYDRIWDDLNQKVIDRYEELTLQQSFFSDAMSQDPAADLWKKFYRGKDPNSYEFELQEMASAAQRRKKAIENYKRGLGSVRPKPLTKAEEGLIRVDTEVEALGYKDLADAQAGIARFAAMRNQAADMKAEIKALKPKVREARILREGLDDVAVIPKNQVKGIDDLAKTTHVLGSYKDIVRTNGQIRDLTRNFKVFFGDKFDEVKKAVLDPFDRAKGDFVGEVTKLGDGLEQGVTKKFGIARGSKLSAAIQRYGDTGLAAPDRMNYDDLVKEFGREKADKVVAADAWFRNEYDRLIDELNEVRKKIYPNNAGKLIPKRKDYYRHFTELGTDMVGALKHFLDTSAEIDSKLAGISEYTSPRSKFLPFAQERTGVKTTIDAVGGFVNYMPLFAYAKHIDPQISQFRYLRRRLAEVAPKEGEIFPADLPDGKPFKARSINNFLTYLDDFANSLAGKTNPLDRFIQDKLIPGGRKTMKAVDWMNNRINANTVLGNLGSAAAQIANIPQGIASAKLHSGAGMARTVASIFTKNEPMEKSIFLRERYLRSPHERFPLPFDEKPIAATADAAKNKAAALLQVTDEIGTKFIWNAHYEKYLAENMTKKDGVQVWKPGTSEADAISYSDNVTRSLVGGRGIGEVPLLQQSKLFKLFNPFQLEVGNFWWITKDFVDRKDFQGLAYLAVANYLFNEAAQRTRGSRVVYDPINALFDGTNTLIQEGKGGDYATGALKFLGRQAGEVLSNMPVGQTIANSVVPVDQRDALFGQGNPSRFGEGPLFAQTLQTLATAIFTAATGKGKDAVSSLESVGKAAIPLVLPFGGSQVKKTYDGLKALITGHTETAAGKPGYNVAPSPENIIRALLFGKGATSEAQKAFKENDDLMSRVNKQDEVSKQSTLEAEADWADLKKTAKDKGNEAAAAKFEEINKTNPDLGKKISDIYKAEQQGLTSTDRLIAMLGVTNGERAKYLTEQFKTLKTNEAKGAYWEELTKKKLINKQVADQISYLLKQEGN